MTAPRPSPFRPGHAGAPAPAPPERTLLEAYWRGCSTIFVAVAATFSSMARASGPLRNLRDPR